MRNHHGARGLLARTLCLLGSRPAHALHPLITGDAFTVGVGTSQLEIGIEPVRIEEDFTDVRIDLLRPVYAYGVLAGITFRW